MVYRHEFAMSLRFGDKMSDRIPKAQQKNRRINAG